ncbi:hypothetical protein J6590_008126 [Homalodisca vitripennis]|nr:hypothetical protein J6590_008126 [Homalodisca vitripennis]
MKEITSMALHLCLKPRFSPHVITLTRAAQAPAKWKWGEKSSGKNFRNPTRVISACSSPERAGLHLILVEMHVSNLLVSSADNRRQSDTKAAGSCVAAIQASWRRV